jgi:transcriptional regulator with XRE-family HTH domain
MSDIFTDIRLASGLSMRALAKEAGVSVKAVWCMENGTSKTSVLTLGKVAKALGYELEELKSLIEGEQPQEQPRQGAARGLLVKYRSLGQALAGQETGSQALAELSPPDQELESGVAVQEPEVVVVVPMTVKELCHWQKRVSDNEARLDRITAALSAAGLMATFFLFGLADFVFSFQDLAEQVFFNF